MTLSIQRKIQSKNQLKLAYKQTTQLYWIAWRLLKCTGKHPWHKRR